MGIGGEILMAHSKVYILPYIAKHILHRHMPHPEVFMFNTACAQQCMLSL